jgi:putative polyketide hydroxylase
VAEHNLARSAEVGGTAHDASDALHVDVGGRIRHLWLRTGAGRTSTLNLVGPGLTLLAGTGSSPWEAAVATLPPRPPISVREARRHHRQGARHPARQA